MLMTTLITTWISDEPCVIIIYLETVYASRMYLSIHKCEIPFCLCSLFSELPVMHTTFRFNAYSIIQVFPCLLLLWKDFLGWQEILSFITSPNSSFTRLFSSLLRPLLKLHFAPKNLFYNWTFLWNFLPLPGFNWNLLPLGNRAGSRAVLFDHLGLCWQTRCVNSPLLGLQTVT